MILQEAVKSREGLAYLGGAALTGLVAVLLAVDTLTSYLHQWELREAVQAFAQGKGEAGRLLGSLRDEDAGDDYERATVRVLLGSHNLRRAHRDARLLDAAERLFAEALEIDSENTAAAVGLACARLRRAEAKEPEARARDAAAAVAELRSHAADPKQPDVRYLEGASLILQGDVSAALEALDDPDPSEAPSLEGSGARLWNLGVAELLAGGATAFEPFALGYALRPHPIPRETSDEPLPSDADPGRPADAPRLLRLAYTVCLGRPGNAEGLRDRCRRAARLMVPFARGAPRRGQAGRFLPHRELLPELDNALGLAYFRAGELEAAVKRFEQASFGAGGREPLYLLNLAWACAQRAAALGAAGDPKLRNKVFELYGKAGKSYEKVCSLLAREEGRQDTVRLARTNAAAAYLAAGDPRQALAVYARYAAGDPDEAQRERDLGVLSERARKRREAIRHYEAAIAAGHPEAGELDIRLRLLRGR
ncbi:MAG: hypothetical protein D6731_17980 [Planctomycetota bacterium]|nr:MAG: hypothetical protein D6731_17980 [Planctomycetota bacterium]